MPNLPAAMYIFFTTSVQSENLTFLGVRSTNPLPAASGLVKLTTASHVRHTNPNTHETYKIKLQNSHNENFRLKHETELLEKAI